ncbi:hypothetical protein PUV54_00155 [Hyphococcus flavus]|uniref:Uncharacterized protein n=1 Tax=Hyphococcus flavus TaxID=1866326 RepID=A0AAE9ZJD9_9PROT|nr:hypothetical protein [Hyphococcus flavus]WDI31605.1 hypothetical protein PUV54_00155 [Hyphococcus flavus]
MTAQFLLKRADESLDYPFDWSQVLQDSETIEAVETTIEPVEAGGLVVTSGGDEVTQDNAQIVQPFLSGGIKGRRYVVRNKITTNYSRIDIQQRTIIIG